MAGLLDFLNSDDAALGIGLLAAGGATTDPNQTSLGSRLARATDYVQQQKNQALRTKLTQSQIDDAASQAQYRQAQTDIARQNFELDQKLFGMLSPGATGGAAAAPAGALPASTLPPPSGISGGVSTASAGPGAVLDSPAGMGPVPNEPAMKLAMNTSPDPRAAAREIAQMQNDLATKPLDPASKQMLQAEIARLQGQQQQYGLPTSAPVQAQSPGAVLAPQAPSAPAAAAPGSVLAGMTPDQIALFQMRGKNLVEPWKIAKFGNVMAPGSLVDKGDGRGPQFMGDPTKGILPSGRLDPNWIADQGSLTTATEGAKQREGARYEPGPVVVDPTTGATSQPSKLATYGGGPGASAPLIGLPTAQKQKDAATAEFNTRVAGDDASKLSALRSGADAGEQAIKTAQNLRRIAASGIYEGGGAQAKTAVASMISGLTGITPKALPGSEEFNAEASNLVLGSIKALGANPSNADRDFIMKTIPQITNNPQAREALLQYMEKKGQSAMAQYQQADAYGRKNGGLGGFKFVDPTEQKPSGWTPPPGVTIREKN